MCERGCELRLFLHACAHAVHRVCKWQRRRPNMGIVSQCPRQTLKACAYAAAHTLTHTQFSHYCGGGIFFMLSLSEREKERCEASVTQCCSFWLAICVCVCLCVLDAMPLIVCQTEFVCISQIETVAVHTEVKICHQRTCTQEVRVSDALILSSKTT